MQRHLLIIGAGSVGKRHARNLHALGCRVSCMDPREERGREAAAETPMLGTYSSLEQALAAARFDGVVVGSPTAFHVDQAVACLERGLPVLLEKPVAITLAEALRLEAATRTAKAPLLLGYTWRWWPPLRRVREMLAQGVLGAVRHVRFVMSAHLADWHPWERYQDFFMASKALGGGALLDESHWLDLMAWFFGMPEHIYANVEKISDLEIETDDNVDILARYPGGLRVSLHLDLYGRPHEKSITFTGDKGSLVWEENRIALASTPEKKWTEETFRHERNDMFLDVVREFLEVLDGAPVRTCDINDGIAVMRLIEAARRSNAEGRAVRLD